MWNLSFIYYFYNGVCSISKAFIVLVSFGFVASVAPFFSFTETLKYRGYVLHPGNLDRINNISQNSEAGVWLTMTQISKYDYGDEHHSSLSAYFRIFTALADDHMIAPHVADVTWPSLILPDPFWSFPMISDEFRFWPTFRNVTCAI